MVPVDAVRPAATVQGRGLGRAPARRRSCRADAAGARRLLATCTDSAQPISNGLYASLGIVPRMPLVRARRAAGAGRPPSGPARRDPASAFDELDGAAAAPRLDEELAPSTASAARLRATRRTTPSSRAEGRNGFLYLDRTGAAVGYGYASEAGRVGPIAVARPGAAWRRSSAISSPPSRRAARSGCGCRAPAGEAMPRCSAPASGSTASRCLLCWDRPFADFRRYVPISPGLL